MVFNAKDEILTELLPTPDAKIEFTAYVLLVPTISNVTKAYALEAALPILTPQPTNNNAPEEVLRQNRIIEESQANKEVVIKYHSSLIQEYPRISISTTKFPTTNMDIAKKIKECEYKQELERFINEIRSSPTPSEDLFQDL
ncbi:hypothetical protein Tco_1457534 [Tanacetum coccineum]